MDNERNIFQRMSIQRYSGKGFMLVISVVFVALIADVILTNLSAITSVSSDWQISLFLVMLVIFGIGQYFILGFIRHKSKDSITKNYAVKLIDRITLSIQYLLIAFFASVALQVVLASYYNTIFLAIALTTSYSLAIAILATLAYLFFSWYRTNKSFVVLLYAFSSISVAISFMFVIIITDLVLQTLPQERTRESEVKIEFFEPNSMMGIIQYLSAIADAVNFFLLWFSTALLLRHYSKRVGKAKFWAVMSIPIDFFVFYYVIVSPLLANLAPADMSSPDMVPILILGSVLPGVAGGILYGVPFIIIARTLPRNSHLRDYLIIAAWAFILVENVSSAGVFHAPYPPFGLYSVLLTSLSCYLLLVALYSSAISISADSRLRQSVRRSIVKESRLLDSIGSAQMRKEIEAKVLDVAKANLDSMTKDHGIQPSVTENDLKSYVEEVISEIADIRQADGKSTGESRQE
jgi:hypothetical protein